MLERGRSRVLVAEGHQWFPMARLIAEEFTTLRCNSPVTGQESDLITEADLVNHGDDAVLNSVLGLQNPSWLQRSSKYIRTNA